MTVALAKSGDDEAPKPGPVPKEALEYFKRKGLKPGFRYTSVWQEEHRLAFTVAKLMEVSILEHVRHTIEKAIENGDTFEDWKKNAEPQLEQSGWRGSMTEAQKPQRLRVIYDTNMRMARANGQHDRIQRTKEFLPFLIYELGPSKEHNPEHVAWAGTTLPVDDPFWNLRMPPSKWGCKCRVRQVSKREADDSKGPKEAPPEELVPYDLPDGRKGSAPLGVDPEFAYPKGTRGREEALNDALDAAQPRRPR